MWQVADANQAARASRAEEAVRRLEGELAAARVKVAGLEAAVRAREAAADKLARTLEAQRREESDAALQVCCGSAAEAEPVVCMTC